FEPQFRVPGSHEAEPEHPTTWFLSIHTTILQNLSPPCPVPPPLLPLRHLFGVAGVVEFEEAGEDLAAGGLAEGVAGALLHEVRAIAPQRLHSAAQHSDSRSALRLVGSSGRVLLARPQGRHGSADVGAQSGPGWN